MKNEIAAWERNANHAKADWQFTTSDARIKLAGPIDRSSSRLVLYFSCLFRPGEDAMNPPLDPAFAMDATSPNFFLLLFFGTIIAWGLCPVCARAGHFMFPVAAWNASNPCDHAYGGVVLTPIGLGLFPCLHCRIWRRSRTSSERVTPSITTAPLIAR
jgi:hypothetical protein